MRIFFVLKVILILTILTFQGFVDNSLACEKLCKVSKETKQVKKIKCHNCPAECKLAPGEVGKCKKYMNKNSKIVPVK